MQHFKGDSMKKNLFRIIRIILFFLTSCICIGIYISTIPSNSMTVTRTRGYTNKENKDLDIWIVGDSCVECALLPCQIYKETNYTSYNSGEAMSKLNKIFEYTIDLYKYQKPKLVVLDTSALFYETSGGEDGHIIEYSNPFYKLYRNHDYWRNQELQEQILLNKGSIINYADTEIEGGYNYLNTNPGRTISNENKKLFGEIINYCKSNGSEVLVISVPMPEIASHQFLTDCKNLCSTLDVSYLDFNYPDKLDGYDDVADIEHETFDKVHLNIFGAKKVTNYFDQYIKKSLNIVAYNKNRHFENRVNEFFTKYSDVYK